MGEGGGARQCLPPGGAALPSGSGNSSLTAPGGAIQVAIVSARIVPARMAGAFLWSLCSCALWAQLQGLCFEGPGMVAFVWVPWGHCKASFSQCQL